LNVTERAILIGNRLLHNLKGIVESDGHNRILGVEIILIEPVNFAALLCSSKLLMTFYHHRRPKEAKIHVIPMSSSRSSTIDFQCNPFYSKESRTKKLMGEKRDCHSWRIINFLKMCVLKVSFGNSVNHDIANRLYHSNIYDSIDV